MVSGQIQRKFVQKRLLQSSEALKWVHWNLSNVEIVEPRWAAMSRVELSGHLDLEMSFRQSAKLKWVTPKEISGGFADVLKVHQKQSKTIVSIP